MHGSETLRLIQEIDPNTQVVVVAGYASEDLGRELLKNGASDFFSEGRRPHALQETIERLRTLDDL